MNVQPQTTVLDDSISLDGKGIHIHARAVSIVWGFADDMFVNISGDGKKDTGSSTVEIQIQLRLGSYDFGVNARRNGRFVEFLRDHCMVHG